MATTLVTPALGRGPASSLQERGSGTPGQTRADALRWGVVGHGWVARDYMMPGIAAAGGNVAAVADPSSAARAAFGGPAYESTEAMLVAEPLDALYIATPNDAHLAPVRAAAAARVPVLCEKPLAASLAVAAMQDGDIYVTNDPWIGTGHLPDVCLVRPIFHGGRLVAFAATPLPPRNPSHIG